MGGPCPCGSGLAYDACCGRYHCGSSTPPTAELLMRSRYSAYQHKLVDYLRTTWHPATRPDNLELAEEGVRWCGLQIVACSAGKASDREGEVEFIASWYGSDGKSGSLHERSRFVQEDGQWFYVDGQLYATPTQKIGRNEPCPCGSGRKFKQCCGK